MTPWQTLLTLIFLGLPVVTACAVAGWAIGKQKHYAHGGDKRTAGAWCGFLLGVIGVLVVLCWKDEDKDTPSARDEAMELYRKSGQASS